MIAWYTRQLERHALNWWLPVLACLASAAALGLVSRHFYGQVPAGARLLVSALMNEFLARGSLLLWAGGLFGFIVGLDSHFLKALVSSYWLLLFGAVLVMLFALVYAPVIQLPNIAGHELDTPDVEAAWHQLETSSAYQLVRLSASALSLGQVALTWWGLVRVETSSANVRSAGLAVFGLGVFLKILGLI